MEIGINIQKKINKELFSITILNQENKIEIRYKDREDVSIIDLRTWIATNQKVEDIKKITLMNDINHNFTTDGK